MESNGGKEGVESLRRKVEDQLKRSVEHAETYPYVWGSYAVVWGGLAIYTTYKWRKLRNMEDRVRTLHQKLKLKEAAIKNQEFQHMKSKAVNKDDSGVH